MLPADEERLIVVVEVESFSEDSSPIANALKLILPDEVDDE